MKKNYLCEFERGVIFLVIIFAISVTCEYFMKSLLIGDFPEMVRMESLAEKGTKIIYIGDSTVCSDARDADKRDVVEMMCSGDNCSIGLVYHSSWDMKIYDAFSEYICSLPEKPEIVIVPVNLRSLSPLWYLRPMYSYKYEVEVIKSKAKKNPYEGVLLRIVNIFSDKKRAMSSAEKTWLDVVVFHFNGSRIGTIRDFNYAINGTEEDFEKRVKDTITSSFLTNISPEHPELKNLDSLITNFRDCGVRPVIYISPIDHEYGRAWMGDEFDSIVTQKKMVIIDIGKKNGVDILDFSFMLNSSSFFDKYYLGEHMLAPGRAKVAEALKREISMLE
jgi:hypothetical protein